MTRSQQRSLIFGFVFTFFSTGACTPNDPEEPIQPNDSASIDPNASTSAGDPALGGGVGGIEEPATPDQDDASDAPLGTLTDSPWGAPPPIGSDDQGTPEDLASPSTAPDSAVGPSVDEGPTYDGAFDDKPVYAPGKRSSTAPRVADAMRDHGKTKKAKNSRGKTKETVEGTGKTKRYISAVILNVRSAPNRNSKIVRIIKGGTPVMVDINGDWAKLSKGEYIRSRHLSANPQRSVSDDEIEQKTSARDGKTPAARRKSHSGPKLKVKPLGRPMKTKEKVREAPPSNSGADLDLPDVPNH